VIVRLLPILGITFIDILGFSILIPLLPYYVQRFGAPPLVLGALFSTFALCQVVSGPVWGNVSDRIGRKRVLIVSQIGAAIGWAMLAVAPTLGFVFAARIIEGLAGGNISVTQAYVSDLVEPAQRPRAFATIGAAFSAGFLFGPFAGGWLAHAYGFAVPFLLAAGLQVATLVLTIVALPESRKPTDQKAATLRDIITSLRMPGVTPILTQKLMYSLALYGWFAVYALVLQRQLGLREDTTSYFFAAFGALSIVMQLGVVSRLTDAVGTRVTNTIGIAATVIAFGVAPFIHDLRTALVMLVFFAFGLSLNGATITSLISDAAPENQRGTILGAGSSLESASGVVMPPISTGALEASGVLATAAISAGFTLIALAIGVVAGWRDKRPEPTPVS
jgi:predicted MFS family arabinose efflux permease